MADDSSSALDVVTDVKGRTVTVFSSMFPQLRSQVRIITTEKQSGRLAAYARSWQATKALIDKVVNDLLDADVTLAAQGLGVQGDQRKAISNSIISAWDEPAAAAATTGDSKRVDDGLDSLKSRLGEFDTAIAKAGEAPVKADE